MWSRRRSASVSATGTSGSSSTVGACTGACSTTTWSGRSLVRTSPSSIPGAPISWPASSSEILGVYRLATRRVETRVSVVGGQPIRRTLAADHSVALELAVQGCRTDLELLGGARLVAAVQLERREDVLLLDLFERPHRAAGG